MERKWLLVSVVLLVLIGSNAFLVYTVYDQKSNIDRLEQSNTKLLRQLSDSNKTIEDLRGTIDQQRKEISALQRDIDRYRNYTLIRLLISVNPTYLTSDFYGEMQAVEEVMKFIWDPLRIMILFQIQPDANAPRELEYHTSALCSTYMSSNYVRSLHHFPTVTVLVTSTYNATAEWAVGGLACLSLSNLIIIDVRGIQYSEDVGAHIITHEFLHLLGFSDDVLYPWDDLSGDGQSATYIPQSWYPQIYRNIVKFRISNSPA